MKDETGRPREEARSPLAGPPLHTEEGEGDGEVEEDKEEENVVEDRNYLMNFVLQLENVAGEDDKSDI